MHKFLFIIKYCCYLFFNLLWYPQVLFPRKKNIWLFGAWYGEKYSDNSKAFFEFIIKTDNSIRAIWITKNNCIKNSLNDKGIECYLKWSLKGILYSLMAKVIIVSSGKQDVNPFFINGSIIINTWHGAPMKRICKLDGIEYKKYVEIIFKYLFPFLNEYNLKAIVSTSDIFNQIMSSSFGIPVTNVVCSGYPRNDVFFCSNIHPTIKKWNDIFNNPIKIFYLPTYRSINEKFTPFTNFEFNNVTMNDFLEESKCILISKGHFVDSKVGNEYSSNRIIHLSDSDIDDLNFVLKDIDILITDYSGVYFDFLLTQKPIIFAPFDIGSYSQNRGFNFNYFEILCGPIAYNWNEVISSLRLIIDEDKYMFSRKNMNNYFNKYHDRNSSERLYKYIINILNQ